MKRFINGTHFRIVLNFKEANKMNSEKNEKKLNDFKRYKQILEYFQKNPDRLTSKNKGYLGKILKEVNSYQFLSYISSNFWGLNNLEVMLNNLETILNPKGKKACELLAYPHILKESEKGKVNEQIYGGVEIFPEILEDKDYPNHLKNHFKEIRIKDLNNEAEYYLSLTKIASK